MKKETKSKKIKELLLKAAKGYKIAEVTVEYAQVDGKMQAVKKKETKKDVPGDLKALQLLLHGEEREDASPVLLTDEELEKEKKRLLNELKLGEENGKV